MLPDSYGDCPGFNCTHPVPSIASSAAAAAAAGAAGRAGVVLVAFPTNLGFPVQGVLQLIAELEGLFAELDPRLLFTCKRIFETLLLVQLLVSSNLFLESVRIMASLTSILSLRHLVKQRLIDALKNRAGNLIGKCKTCARTRFDVLQLGRTVSGT